MHDITVLSLFDGISCGQLALQRAGISVNKYYSSEIDKYAIKITQKNFPETIQLGDVIYLDEWKLDKIDLLMGGFPCQGFSSAGLGLGFDDHRSGLFKFCVDALEKFKPKYFLFENVRMKKEWKDVISSYFGVEPIQINSALVSAQNRIRLYWTNIPGITQPEDKGLLLKDIIEDGKVSRIKNERFICKDRRDFRAGSLEEINYKIKHKIVVRQSVHSIDKKSPTVVPYSGGNSLPRIIHPNSHWRVLTPIECERLQTIPDNYTEGVSNTQRYKMLGNGWTVDVIAHILSFMEMKSGKIN